MAEAQAFIPEVINAHFDEASFLYSEYQTEIKASEPNVDYLNGVIARLGANLDGLVINAAAAWAFCEAAIEGDDAGEFFVASYLAFQSAELEKVKLVVDSGQADSQLLQAIANGLAWHPWALSGFWATKFTSAKQITMKSIGLFCFNRHKKSFPIKLSDLLGQSLANKDLNATPLLLDIASKNEDSQVLPVLQQYSVGELDKNSFQVLETRLKLDDTSALAELKLFVLNENLHREAALNLAFSQLETTQAKQWVGELNAIPNSARWILLAVGAMNEKPLLPWVVKQMEVPELARISAKVFSQLSGVDLKEKGWLLSDDSMDEQWLALEGDEDLDWPDVVQIKQGMNYE